MIFIFKNYFIKDWESFPFYSFWIPISKFPSAPIPVLFLMPVPKMLCLMQIFQQILVFFYLAIDNYIIQKSSRREL